METDVLEDVQLDKLLTNQKELILHNDDYNTFDHVIECLVAVCKHELTQAEQCAYIVHHNGKCSVKRGVESKLKPMYTALKHQNLTVELS